MTPEGQSQVPDSVRESIRTHHPGIEGEIEGAIKTLHKLRQITGGSARAAVPANASGNLEATIEATLPVGAQMPSADSSIEATEAEPTPAREAPVLAASTSFGRYQIIRLLGKGAMGAVYLAYDTQLHRHVALKTPSIGNTPQTIDRFFREARSAAQLRSPYLCPIYDVGQIAGTYYLSMAFVDGQPLSRVLAKGLLKTTDDVISIIKKVARGVQKAHDAGIIHRDLKPDNIMIDQDGEPVVMDFGLARKVFDDVQVTMSGVMIGTPGYMSPEQVNGDTKRIGHATDIYALGVVLFQLLAGRLPFQGSLTSILRQIGSDPPPLPSLFNQGLAKDCPLEQICLKMIAKLPEERFASMREVADALEALGSHDEVRLPEPSMLSRLRSWTSGIFSSRAAVANTIAATRLGTSEAPASGADQETIAETHPPR
jgi:serine/threonine protein kinase